MDSRLLTLHKKLYLSENKQQLLLRTSSINEAISPAELTQAISQSHYSAWKIDPAGIQQASISLRQLASGKEVQDTVVAECMDAQLTIFIDPPALIAKAKIISAYGGRAITLDQITEKIKSLNISYGLSKKILHLLIQKSKKAPPGTLYQATIAKGLPAVNGINATFERLVETPSERVMKPQQRENGQVDMRELGELVTVSPGTPIMRKIPHQEGTPGCTVTGESIAQRRGEDRAFTIGDNTELAPHDKNLLIASIAGIPHQLNNGMKVDNALIIENVNVGFGNVNYEGDVIVAGDISDGMKVKASGNITVAGFIESARLECGGDLTVGKGILGRKRTSEGTLFSCQISCRGSVTASFSQYTQMDIGKDLTVKNQLLHCIVHCQGHINVSNEAATKGVILGGRLSAYRGVSSVTLGAPSGARTSIDLTGLYPELSARKKQISLAIKTEQAKLHSVFETQAIIAAAPLTKKRKAIDIRLTTIQTQAEKALQQLLNTQENNLTAIQEYINHSKVTASGKLYRQVSVVVADDTFQSTHSDGPTCISIIEGKLVASPYHF